MQSMKLDKSVEDGGEGGRSVQRLRVGGRDSVTNRSSHSFYSIARAWSEWYKVISR